jgi:hypothetical protein
MGDKPVTESIDARILRLLQLENVFDLDYDTYATLLKEALVMRSVIGKKKIPTEEIELLRDEFKKVKGKTGRFKPKPKSKAIKADKITSVKSVGSRLLPAGRQSASGMPLVKSLENVGKIVQSISDNLSEQSKNDNKVAEENRKEEENERRRKREERLESGVKKVVAATKKLFSPVKSIFDSLFNYLFYTFLGSTLAKAFDWFADTKNKEKVSALGRFVKDFWPAILGTYVAFFTPLGSFIVGVISTLTKLALAFPLVAAAAAASLVLIGAGTVGIRQRQQKEEALFPEKDREGEPIQKTTQQRVSEVQKKALIQIADPMGPGPIGSALSGGGVIDSNTGVRISGAGPDTQLTALQPGEVVMNRSAVSGIGLDRLLALNAKFGGSNANKPKFAGNIQFAQGGGIVGALSKILPGTGSVMAPRGTSLGIQDKILGMNVGSRRELSLRETYAQSAVERYNKNPNAPSRLVTFDTGPLAGRHISVPKTRQSTAATAKSPTKPSSGLNPFKNFGSNVQTIQDAGRRQEEMMRQMGHKPSGYVNLFGQPVKGPSDALGPQSRALPPTPPTGKGRTTIINLPPTYEAASAGMKGSSKGTEVPSFSAIAPGNQRQKQSEVYGLVG